MDICSHNHEEIVIENARYCPLCEVMGKIDELEKTISQLEDEINSLEEEIKNKEV